MSKPLASPMDRTVRIATRQSPLALWQANYVAERLAAAGCRCELIPMNSRGDIDLRPIAMTPAAESRTPRGDDRPNAANVPSLGGPVTVGLFTRGIQAAVAEDRADIAVHSMKDLPTADDPRFELAAVPPRGDVRDCLVSPSRMTIDSLPPGACVGTGSVRRAAQLLMHRPDLTIQPIRGNVGSRLAKLRNGDFDAIVLAAAGLERLENNAPRRALSTTEMLPAPAQGALAVEIRRGDQAMRTLVGQLDDVKTRIGVMAERSILASLNGGCLAPISVLATWESAPQSASGESSSDNSGASGVATLRIAAWVGTPDGSQAMRITRRVEGIQWPPSGLASASESDSNNPSSLGGLSTDIAAVCDEIVASLRRRGCDEMIAGLRD